MKQMQTLSVLMAATVLAYGAAGLAVDQGQAQHRDFAGLKPGRTFSLGGKQVTVKTMDVLPLVNNEFSKRYKFDCFGNETLAKLRKQEKLDEVIAAGKTEFAKMVLLMDWAHKRIKLFGPPKSKPKDMLELLKAVDEGAAFNCGSYQRLLKAALKSCGFVARSLGLKGAKGDGNGSEHGVVEAWSNQHRKWVMLDSTLSVYFTKGGVPLNGYEIRREWFYNEKGKDLTIVVGAAGKKHTVADLPIARGTHRGFGTLRLKPESIGKFLYLAYTPTRPDGKPDYGKMFITKDSLCEGVKYHTRICPKDSAREPYWPVQQAALALTAGDGTTLNVKAGTNTPDFEKFQHRIDGGQWTDGAPETWKLHAGGNTLDVRAVNKFGVKGSVSKVVLEMK